MLRACTFKLVFSSPRLRRPISVLAFESSADDTCAAIVTSDRKILANVVVKQHHLHEQFGGIEPITAIDAHHRNMVSRISIQKTICLNLKLYSANCHPKGLQRGEYVNI